MQRPPRSNTATEEPETAYVPFEDSATAHEPSLPPSQKTDSSQSIFCVSPRKAAKDERQPEKEVVQSPVPNPKKKLSLLRRLELANRATDHATSIGIDAATNTLTDRVLTSIGEVLDDVTLNYFYGAPAGLRQGMHEFVVHFWAVTKPVLRESIVGTVTGDFSHLLLQVWTTEYPYFWPQGSRLPRPWHWLRARYLYAYYPADQTLFNKARNPLYVLILLLKCSSYTSVPIFMLRVWKPLESCRHLSLLWWRLPVRRV